jgi:DNA invertase Pin-like site-specific DNA recombinase
MARIGYAQVLAEDQFTARQLDEIRAASRTECSTACPGRGSRPTLFANL